MVKKTNIIRSINTLNSKKTLKGTREYFMLYYIKTKEVIYFIYR